MRILSTDRVQAFPAHLPWGTEAVVQVEGHIYLACATFETRDEAIAAGAQLIDEGGRCLLVRARDRFTVWQAVSARVQAEVLGFPENPVRFRGRLFDLSQTPDTETDPTVVDKIRYRGRKIDPDTE